jgi:Flp pilus assembly protein CpaB
MQAIASGFASLPHSRVDVMLTVKRNDDKTSYVALLLQDVLVLAADLITDRTTGIAAPSQIVTFALKPEEVFRVNMAKEMGALTLALRKPTDRSKAEFEKMTWEEMLAGKKKISGPDSVAAPNDSKSSVGPPRTAAKAADQIPAVAAKPPAEAKSSDPSTPAGGPSAKPSGPAAETALQGTHRELTIMNGKDQLRIPYTVLPSGQRPPTAAPPRKDAPKGPTPSTDVL